jgi:hypothetical protein
MQQAMHVLQRLFVMEQSISIVFVAQTDTHMRMKVVALG